MEVNHENRNDYEKNMMKIIYYGISKIFLSL